MAGGVGPGRLELEQRPRPSPAAWAGARLHCGSAARLAPGISGHSARKHKREEEAEDQNSPVRKKRLTEALCSSRPVSESWDPSTSQKMLGEVLNQYNSCPAESVLESPFEEMEETAWEQQCEAARRKLKEIEDRLIDEDEVVEADHTVSRLPTLVLSDALKNGLKRELHEDLTKKIVECILSSGVRVNKERKAPSNPASCPRWADVMMSTSRWRFHCMRVGKHISHCSQQWKI
uniref:Coiled-coil domain-containing protein 117 isoform X2 n=1 Tax=Geotrypetes seraphini TaxID=260995 RepID=A0A6P8RX63_GEOSA|nr:coiled-coil domain-containing protein 117 isoform X2 [Geotrypetes seraphini]